MKRIILFQTSILGVHVNFQGCMFFWEFVFFVMCDGFAWVICVCAAVGWEVLRTCYGIVQRFFCWCLVIVDAEIRWFAIVDMENILFIPMRFHVFIYIKIVQYTVKKTTWYEWYVLWHNIWWKQQMSFHEVGIWWHTLSS